jgi:alpha-beta hydrolase superfamily lysophospholipase
MPVKKNRLWFWVKIILIIYGALGIALYYLQDKILFHPRPLPQDHQWNFPYAFKEINIPYTAASRMNVIQFTADSVPKGVVIYFHGNKYNISRYAPVVPTFTKNGWEIWMLDYPGFGKSTGQLTEQTMYDWALVFYKLARAKYEPTDIIIYGRSMGTGIATQLASVRDCRYLVLEAPYYSFPSIFNTYFPLYPYNKIIKYDFPTWKFIKDVTAPVVIFHGTADEIIPYRNGKKLIPLLKKTDEFIAIPGAFHNDLDSFSTYKLKLDSILR